MTAKAVLETLSIIWRQLAELGSPMAVMGGLALSVWRHVRTTQDVDVLIAVDAGHESRLLELLLECGFRPKTSPPIRPLGLIRHLQLLYEPEGAFVDIRVDLLFADSEYHRAALDRRISVHFEEINQDLYVLSCEDLIIHKLLAGRMQDRVDTTALLQANRESIDFGYVAHWLRELGLREAFGAAWCDAFGDSLLPKEIPD
jgi:hypothetical protein